MNNKQVGLDFCTWSIYLVRTNEKEHSLLSGFYLILVYLPGLRVFEIRDLYSWSHPSGWDWKNSGSFCVGQVRRTSQFATRSKKHVSDASVPRCRGLLQQAPPPVCPLLVVEPFDVVRTSYTCTCPWTTLYCFISSCRLVLPKKYPKIVCCCLLLLYFFFLISLFFAFRSPPKCKRY